MTFRDECSNLRSQLNEQHREENRVSLEELTKMKDLQRDELRAELQSKIDALKKTVSIYYIDSIIFFHLCNNVSRDQIACIN